MDNQPWIKKHIPKSLKEIIGQEEAIKKVKEYLTNWNRKKKPLFLYGPTGTGKSSIAYAAANDFKMEFFEVNASDRRNAEGINTTIGNALNQGSLFGNKKLIVVDEVDGLSGSQDRGGLQALIKLLKNAPQPIIIIGDDAYSEKLRKLTKACEPVELKLLTPKEIMTRLKEILEKEGIKYQEDDLRTIAYRVGGDLRAAINDAQTATANGKLDVTGLELGVREKKQTIKEALMRVFKTTSASIARGAFDNIDEDIDKVMLWLDENLPKEYTETEDLARAYEAMSKADIFLGRIRRWQHYRFYVYAYDLITAGIAIAKNKKYNHNINYKETTRILKIWMANQKNARRKSIAEKLGEANHTSTKKAFFEVPFLKPIIKTNPELKEALELSSDEVEWLKK